MGNPTHSFIGWIDVDRSTSKNLKKCSSYKYFYKPVTSIIKNQVFQKKKKYFLNNNNNNNNNNEESIEICQTITKVSLL